MTSRIIKHILIISLVCTCVPNFLIAQSNQSSGLLGQWRIINDTYNPAFLRPPPQLDIQCQKKNGKLQISILRNKRVHNLGYLSCKYYQDTPTEAWVYNKKLFSNVADWFFFYDSQNDKLTIKANRRRAHGEWHYYRLNSYYPCVPDRRHDNREKDRRDRDYNNSDRQTTHEEDKRPDSQERNKNQKNKKDNEHCTPKITRIWRDGIPDQYSNHQKLVIEGKCFPKRCRLWKDGKYGPYLDCKWISKSKIRTIVVVSAHASTSGREEWHEFQVEDLETGKKSAKFRFFY